MNHITTKLDEKIFSKNQQKFIKMQRERDGKQGANSNSTIGGHYLLFGLDSVFFNSMLIHSCFLLLDRSRSTEIRFLAAVSAPTALPYLSWDQRTGIAPQLLLNYHPVAAKCYHVSHLYPSVSKGDLAIRWAADRTV